MRNKVHVDAQSLIVEDQVFDLSGVERLIVVGAGKASAALAIEFDRQIVPALERACPDLQIDGWVNCPEGTFREGDCRRSIVLHAARPAGLNEPTPQAVEGTRQILNLVSNCGPKDFVLCLLSGGGSALLTAPIDGITLEDKQFVARCVAAAGGNIEQLNAVRRAISQVKGGGLARSCTAPRMLTLAISDVLGDAPATIASGPTIADCVADPLAAFHALEALGLAQTPQLATVVQVLQQLRDKPTPRSPSGCDASFIILGNNADAVDAAGSEAVALGYRYVMESAREAEPDVMQVADRAVNAALQMLSQSGVNCWISGGEPTVCLPPGGAGKGGRNQQLVLSVMRGLSQRGWNSQRDAFAFLSGGTDGEDGPTDAAGAVMDNALFQAAQTAGLSMDDYLAAANAYPFFDQLGGLIRSGPSGTNVCDLRVALTPASDL